MASLLATYRRRRLATPGPAEVLDPATFLAWPYRRRRLATSGPADVLDPARFLAWPYRRRRLGPALATPERTLSFPEALVAAIRADATLGALIGGRVYPGHLPQGATYPAVAMRIARTYGRDLDGRDGTADARVEFTSHSLDYLESRSVVAALVALFGPLLRARLSGVMVLAAYVPDDDADYLEPDDASDDGTFADSVTITFLYET